MYMQVGKQLKLITDNETREAELKPKHRDYQNKTDSVLLYKRNWWNRLRNHGEPDKDKVKPQKMSNYRNKRNIYESRHMKHRQTPSRGVGTRRVRRMETKTSKQKEPFFILKLTKHTDQKVVSE